jgi:hypothetical protein
LNARMPARGIDPAWQFAMNQAVARHLRFGPEIMFTYGPYASLATRTYDPATDRRMMWGSLLLGLSYMTALLFLAHRHKRHLIVTLLLFLATFGPGEALFLSYPFLLVLCVLKQADTEDPYQGTALNWRRVAAVLVMWSTLGLLPLVKVSFLLPFAAAVAIPPALLAYRRHFWQALLLFSTPIAAILAFWVIAGQSLYDIPAFLRGTLSQTSGYTEAMSTAWSVLPRMVGSGLVLSSLVISALVLVSVSRSTRLTVASKWALGILCGVFFLVALKHGFVIVMSVSGTFATLAVFALIMGFLYVDRYLVWALSIAILITAATSIIRDPVLIKQVHGKFGVGVAWTGGQTRGDILAFCLQRAREAYERTTYKSTLNTYTGAWKGLYSRVNNDLENQFVAAKANINHDYPLPVLKGTTDLYDDDQSVLLASGNAWNPRPVIQSYSAYTPALASLDEQHLRRQDAPDWVLFDLQTIDERLPSLDDGLSWPAFLDNYTFVSYDGHFVLMRKNHFIRPQSRYDDISTGTYQSGTTVSLPQTDGLLFAEVELKPTLAGRLLIALYAPPQVHITLDLENGKTRTFRVIPNMMKTVVLLSPLVSNTAEFASLVAGSGHLLDEERVRTISIAPSYGGSLFWSGKYELTLKKYTGK